MDIKDQIEFERMQAAFFAGMVENPNDVERMRRAYQLFIKWIDALVDRECSKILTRSATLKQGNTIKGGGGLQN